VHRVSRISSTAPKDWADLEDAVAGILRECAMTVTQRQQLELPAAWASATDSSSAAQ